MEDDGARSPSLFENVNAGAPRDISPESNSHIRPRSRGRSPTRKPATSNKQRAAGEQIQHVAPMLDPSPETRNQK